MKRRTRGGRFAPAARRKPNNNAEAAPSSLRRVAMRRRGGAAPLPPLLDTDELVVGEHYYARKPGQPATSEEKLITLLISIKKVNDNTLEQHRIDRTREPPSKRTRFDRENSADDAKSTGSGVSQSESQAAKSDESPKGTSDKSETPSSDKVHRLYYVHYHGLDRRLDEWLERDRFVGRVHHTALVSPAVPLNGGEAKEHGAITRSQKRIHVEFHHQQTSYDDMDATTARLEKEHEERTKIRNIETVVMNGFQMSTWYFSPYPFVASAHVTMYICDFCLVYSDAEHEMAIHRAVCTYRQPPGDEIYRDEKIALYEVVGKCNKTYCQALCLLSKLFLDHKTLYFDVDTFFFYILCEVTESGARIMGHFSKEVQSENNLACIMILPPYQRKGYGKLLIQISYELSRREGWIGTPEKPLSDLGKVSYRSFWWWRIVEYLKSCTGPLEDSWCSELARVSLIAGEDVLTTMDSFGLVKNRRSGADNMIRLSRQLVEECLTLSFAKKPAIMLKKKNLKWKPRFPRGPPLRDFLDYR